MPIKPSILLLVVTALLPALVEAQGRVLIRKAEQLVKERSVRVYLEPYRLASSANVIYKQCGQELGITEAQQGFIKARFDALSRDFLNAFEEAFVEKTGVSSDPALVQDYVRYMTGLQRAAVEKTAKAIATSGCKDRDMTKIVDYYTTIQTKEANGEKVPMVAAVKKKEPR